MTFWQGLTISILAATTGIEGDTDDSDKWGRQAQNFLICLEMLLFSIAHFYCFPTDEWQEGYQPTTEKKTKFGDNLALNDFVADFRLIMRGSSKSKSTRKKNKGKESSTEKGYGALSESVESMPTFEEGADGEEENAVKDLEHGESSESEDEGKTSTDHDISEEASESNDNIDDQSVDEEMQSDVLDSSVDNGVDSSFDADEVVETIRTSLDANDQDVREAASRLMSSAVVQKMSEKEDDHKQKEEYDDDDIVPPDDCLCHPKEDEEEEPNETTNLLGGSSPAGSRAGSNEDLLRPSIFTKVGDMDMGAMNKFS